MSMNSTLVTAPNKNVVDGYRIEVGSKVNTEEIVVNNKADELYEKIHSSYTLLNKFFQEIAAEYRKCASQSVKGDSICASLKKVASNCEKQGQFCLNKQRSLENLYTKDKSDKYTAELEYAVDADTVGSLNSRVDDLEARISSLEGNSVVDAEGEYVDYGQDYVDAEGDYVDFSELDSAEIDDN